MLKMERQIDRLTEIMSFNVFFYHFKSLPIIRINVKLDMPALMKRGTVKLDKRFL